MSTPNDDLPEEVRAQVEQIRSEEGLTEEVAPAQTEEEHPIQLSRRAQKQKEREEELQAAREQATKAEAALEELRRGQAEERAARARLEESMAQLTALARITQQPQQEVTQPQPGEWRDKYDRQMAKAKEALQSGDLDEYHKRFAKAQDIRAEARILPKIPNPQQFQQPAPQQFQKPPWVQAVENEYPDVITHERGFDVTASFVRMINPDPRTMNADVLRKAFNRAREELGTKQRNDQQREQKRQLLAGGGGTGAARAVGGGKGGPTVKVKLAQGLNPAEIAKRAGITPQQYARAYGQMNPGDVERE